MRVDLHKTEDVLTAIDVACQEAELSFSDSQEVLYQADKLLKLYTKQRLLKELRSESKEIK